MGSAISGCIEHTDRTESLSERSRTSSDLSLTDFELLRSVGRGTFGRVMLVRRLDHPINEGIYALKYISKSQCVKQKAVRNIINERRILERLNHPLICNLQAAFQDADHLYFLIDPMMGGDLAFHLGRCGTFPEEVVRFHAIEIILALTYLHRKGIVHRDIKPANILLDERGHCHLTDFNVAGRLRKDHPMRTVAGTYNYMAPELFRKKGYYESVDWWSLGVTLFECLYGRTPFRGKSRLEIKENILAHRISRPKKSPKNLSSEITNLLNALLNPDVDQRLGSKGHPIRQHPFFANVDWTSMERKALPAPFQPDPALVKTDALYHLEEVLLHDAPLQPKDVRRGQRPGRKEEEVEGSPWNLMRVKFTDFDRSSLKPSDRLVRRGIVPASPETIAEATEKLTLGTHSTLQTTPHDSRNTTVCDEPEDGEGEEDGPMVSAQLDGEEEEEEEEEGEEEITEQP
ncbi:MAG: AGC/YANK protein kinase [Piptocephalis tieghemiana]|nr:MAG: AGC/YANK protein kinase [Piptocephalis tieghemiana]